MGKKIVTFYAEFFCLSKFVAATIQKGQKLNAHTDVSSRTREPKCGLHLYFDLDATKPVLRDSYKAILTSVPSATEDSKKIDFFL